jgi:uncharacterized damage-inducible protein DinB
MNAASLSSIFRFNGEANLAVLDVAARLSQDDFTREVSPSHGSVQKLLVHILGGEVYFVAACRGQQPDMSAIEGLQTVADLRARWIALNQDAADLLARASQADLDAVVTLQFGEHRFELTMWQVMMQIFSHSQQHRGELSIVLSTLGHPLPTIDLMMHFIKESGQSWPFGDD